MRSTSVLRILAIGGVLGAALSAHAFFFTINGTVNSDGGITSTTGEYSNLPEFGSSFSYDLLAYTNGDGTITFGNGDSTLTLDGVGSSVDVNNVYALSGTFTATAAANTSVVVGATGTYTSTFDLADGYFTFTAGGANPTPEPASMAALGIGIAAIIRRRRKA